MATAGDRLQIVIGAKDELSAQLRETRRELTQLGRTANEMHKRMEAGEQGLQDEYEQTRVDLERTREKYESLRNEQRKNTAELKQLTEGTRSQGRAYDYMNRQAEELKRTTRSMQAGWGKMVGAVAAVTGAVAAAGFAFRFLGDSIEEARTARKALAQTGAVLRSMGRSDAPEKIEQMIDALMLSTGIDDDAIREATNVLLTFGNVGEDIFAKVNRLTVDLSVAFDKDLRASAVMVGKALNDPIKGLTALSRIGVQFTAEQQEQIKAMMEVGDVAGAQGIILKELERQVGGSAAAQADAIDKTIVAWGNFKEAIGDVILDTVGYLSGMGDVDPAKGLRKAKKWIDANRKDIIVSLMRMAGWSLKFGAATAKVGEIVLAVYADLSIMLGGIIKALGWLGKSDSMMEFGDSMIGAGEMANESAVEMGKMAAKLDALGTNALYAADGLAQTTSSWQALKDAGVPKKVLDASRNTPLAYAMGGDVAAGTTALVGEIGPELFVPNVGSPRMIGEDGPEIRDFATSGVIIPNHLLAPAMAVQAPAVVVPAAQPAGVQIGEVHVHDRVDLQREMDALLARQRRIAAERS
jgi:hypothetical protein